MRVAAAIFILLFFWFFTFHGLETPFTFDDGTTVIAVLQFFDTPFWRDLLNILLVFTSAFRPLTTLFWKPLYYLFGFDPLPYRIVVHLLLMANLPLVYIWARRIGTPATASALTVLVFCYNASMLDLFYNTCLVGDVMCFLFYGLAFVAFVSGHRVWTILCFLLALDSKEQAVTLPAMLLLYLVMFRLNDLRDRRKAIRLVALPVLMLAADVAYLWVKVADMSRNPSYHPHATIGFVLKNVAHNVEQLMYFPENSISIAAGLSILAALAGLGFLLRSGQAVFGVLFFVATLLPIAVIDPRAGYAAYIPYFGLALTISGIVDAVRTRFLGNRAVVPVFVASAIVLGWGHLVKREPGVGYYEWSNPTIVSMLRGFEENVPSIPPGVRILLLGDRWAPDWGPMFLVRLMYHENAIWVDRPQNLNHPPDPMAYDIVVEYTPPDVTVVPARLNRHVSIPWEMRSSVTGTGAFVVSSPHAKGAVSRVKFTPDHVKKNQKVTVTLPGLSGGLVNVMYRFAGKPELVQDWCAVDAQGTCQVYAPAQAGALVVDWIQPAGQKWIFTGGVLTVTD
jgi:hypothetical protein